MTLSPGTDVVYNWDPDPSTLTFTTLTTQTVRVTADNPLSKPQTVEVVVRVTDQEFDVSDLEVMSEIMLQERTEEEELERVFFLTGEEVQISCNITGGNSFCFRLYLFCFCDTILSSHNILLSYFDKNSVQNRFANVSSSRVYLNNIHCLLYQVQG